MAPRRSLSARHAVPGRRPVREALRAGREVLEVVVDERAGLELGEIEEAARGAGVAVRRAAAQVLDGLARGVLHQGVVAVTPPFPYAALTSLAPHDLLVVLDGVTDPHNLGAVARTAQASGAGGVVVRERRGVGVTPAAEKAAAGALSWIPVAAVTNVTRALHELAAAGLWSVGLAAEAADDVWEAPLLDGRVAIVVGAEGRGLSRLVAERVDALVRVPMRANVSSLNASVAAAVVLYEVARRRRDAR